MPKIESASYPEIYPPQDALSDMAQVENLNFLTQPQEISDRASDLVINSAARYPQSTKGDTIIADKILDELNPDRRPNTGIGIREIALIEPDPVHCADGINKIHDAFHIPYRVKPDHAAKRVSGFAASALEEIRTTTVEIAGNQNTQLPYELMNPCLVIEDGVFSGGWKIDRAAAFRLEEFLAATPHIRELVSASVKQRADELRAHSREQQAFAQTQVSVPQS